MSRARNLADLLDSNGDVVSGALDNVPPSNDASALTTGTLPVDRVPYVGRRNLIINGGFDVWQRGTSFLSSASTKYTADRWQVYGAGSSTLDITRQSFSAGQTDVEGNPQYYIRLDNTPDADSTWMEIFQRIEDVTYFSGITVTLSFWIRSNRSIVNQNYFSFVQNFGSGGSSNVSTASSNFDISTTWEKKTLTVTLPSIAGKTIGSGNYLELHLLQSSSVQADTYYDIAQVQLEVGSVATPFEHRSYGEELALCRRYFTFFPDTLGGVTTSGASAIPMWTGNTSSGSTRVSISGSPKMRSTPSLSLVGTSADGGTSPSIGQDGTFGVYITTFRAAPGVNVSEPTVDPSFRLNVNSTSGLTAGGAAGFYFYTGDNTSPGDSGWCGVTLDAEL